MKAATAASTFDSIQRYSIPILLLSLSISHLVSPTFLLGFKNADFGSDFTLLGDAKRNSSCVNLTTGAGSSFGNLIYKKQFKLIDEESHQPVSFSTDFVFSMSSSHHGGDGLALVMGAADHPTQIFGKGPFGVRKDCKKKFVAVEYDTRKDKDGNGDHVGVGVGSFKVRDAVDTSSIGLVLNEGERMRSWVDYEAGSKRLEIRLSKFGSRKPYDPLVSSGIDLLNMWGDKGVLMGISSSSGKNSKLMTNLWSWSFRIGAIAIGPSTAGSIHANPPDDQHEDEESGKQKIKKKNRVLKILGGVIFVTGCGTLIVFFMLLFWVIVFGSRYEVPPEVALKSVDFRYEKVDVTVDSVSEVSSRTSSIHD